METLVSCWASSRWGCDRTTKIRRIQRFIKISQFKLCEIEIRSKLPLFYAYFNSSVDYCDCINSNNSIKSSKCSLLSRFFMYNLFETINKESKLKTFFWKFSEFISVTIRNFHNLFFLILNSLIINNKI